LVLVLGCLGFLAVFLVNRVELLVKSLSLNLSLFWKKALNGGIVAILFALVI